MSTWNDVLKNEKRQRDTYAALATAGHKRIEDFYPELHDKQTWAGVFANNVGAHLLPHLLNSPHVLVDLYDWPTPAEFTRTYHVGFDFLLTLRDRGLVQIAANLPVDQYEKVSWLHEVLADHRTIFRSTRTPLFFQSLNSSFHEEHRELFDRLTHELNRMGDERFQQLSTLANAAYRPNRKDQLANALTVWSLRLKTFRPDEGAEICDRLLVDPENVIPNLRLQHFVAVSTTTAGLGGEYSIALKRLRTYLARNPALSLIVDRERVRIEAINEFLSLHTLGKLVEDLETEDYWESISRDKTARKRMLDTLLDSEERKQAFAVERALRSKITIAGQEWSRDDVEEYVDRLDKSWERTCKIAEIGCVTPVAVLPLIFTGVIETFTGIVGAGATIAGCAAFKPIAQRFLETVLPRLQVVNYVRTHKR